MPSGSIRKHVSLKAWLRLSLSGFAACLIAASAWIVWPVLSGYRDSERNLRGIRAYHLLLTTANRISAERVPSNIAMSEMTLPGGVRRLAEARETTDLSLDAVLGIDRTWGEPALFETISRTVLRTHAELREVRAEVDRIIAMPAASRTQEALQDAADRMIMVSEDYQQALDVAAEALGSLDPFLDGVTMVAQGVSDLREFGGRISAHIISSVIRRQPLTDVQIQRFQQADGRLLEVERLLKTQVLFQNDPEFRELTKTVHHEFFGKGLPFLRGLMSRGQAGKSYSVEPSQMRAIYLPTLKPLEDIRNRYLSLLIDTFEERRHMALARLGLTLFGSLLLLGAAFWFLDSVRRKVLLPLLTAQEAVVSLAGNHSIERMSFDTSISEMRTLFSAVSVLAAKIGERRQLVEDLRVQAETDRLTELANRRGFEAMAAHALRHGLPERLGILYFDLDHFKLVNDKLGHRAGDALLAEVANRLRSLCDARVSLARLGGDEFAAIADGFDPAELALLAERIVRSLVQPFDLEGQRARIGISIGIAVWRSPQHDIETLCRQADIALYEAKASGRNGYRVFDDTMEASFRGRARDATEMAGKSRRRAGSAFDDAA